MKILSWNCQGLGNPWTVRSLRNLVRGQAPMVCFLMETRLNKEGFDELCGDLPFPNRFIVKYPNTGGGLALIWKKEIQLDVVNYTANHILAKVVEDDGFVWFLSGFYGWPEAREKVKSWALIRQLGQIVEGSWMCIGDFNAILNSTEKLSKRPPDHYQMDAFREALDNCQLEDLGFRGYQYTWNNKWPGDVNTKQRLGRAMATTEWRVKFPRSIVTHLSSHASDHLPILLQVIGSKKVQQKERRRFQFEEAWLLHEDCEDVIKQAWESGGSGSSLLDLVKQKVAACASDLHAWGAPKTHPQAEEIKRLQRQIQQINEAEITEESKAEFLVASKNLDALLLKQEIYSAQRSRISWLKHGDKNTKFFHSKASQRKWRNYIQSIKNADDVWVEEEDDIAGVVVEYFENLFKAGTCERVEECLNTVTPKITPNMQNILSSTFSADEVKTALFQMGPPKAPGPDGMNAFFYQKFWHVVGDMVVNAVLDFLNFGHMVSEINSTYIVLIPKVKSPEKMSDFRPISLCNVIYKIISKVLANRLKQILPQIISPTQSAFVLGRLITDNVLVAYETLHTMQGRKIGKKGSLALKLDVSKAYDRVEWSFLKGIMVKLGFPDVWVDRVMCCVTTPSYYVLINGKTFGHITPSRGLRQGDPLSPYLFLLCTEGFTSLLHNAEMEGQIRGVSICRRAPKITNLLFADDSLIFCQATQNEV